jgi:hypothetical protein
MVAQKLVATHESLSRNPSNSSETNKIVQSSKNANPVAAYMESDDQDDVLDGTQSQSHGHTIEIEIEAEIRSFFKVRLNILSWYINSITFKK